MSNAWYIETPNAEGLKSLAQEGVAAPPLNESALAPTPQQVFDALAAFPEFSVTIKRRTRTHPTKGERKTIDIPIRRPDGKYAVEIRLHKVTDDDKPALVIFEYGSMDDIKRIAAKLAEVCGPLILWNDAGGPSIVVYPETSSHLENP